MRCYTLDINILLQILDVCMSVWACLDDILTFAFIQTGNNFNDKFTFENYTGRRACAIDNSLAQGWVKCPLKFSSGDLGLVLCKLQWNWSILATIRSKKVLRWHSVVILLPGNSFQDALGLHYRMHAERWKFDVPRCPKQIVATNACSILSCGILSLHLRLAEEESGESNKC